MAGIIFSPPGMGKTTYITEKIRDDAKKRANNPTLPAPVLIVPEQNHFETERMIYKKLGARLYANAEIVSFTKLGAKIIAESKKDKAYASDTVREIIMFKVVRGLKGRLSFYTDAAARPDFAARMLKITEVFGREGVSPEELSDTAQGIDSARLAAKLRDLAAIYGGYTKAVSENFSDRFDEIRLAADAAFQMKYFAGKNIYIDGFDGFSGGQFLMLDAIIRQASSLIISVTADKLPTSDPRYITSARLARKLESITVKNKKDFYTEYVSVYPERNPGENTEIYLFPDTYSESEFVAAKIRELITAGGYSQSEIAVLNAPSPKTLSGSFSAYGISEFSDIPEPIIEKPMIRFIITALEAAADKPGAMLNFIKSGFMRVSMESISLRDIKVSGQRRIYGKRIYDCARPKKKSYRPGREYIKLLTRAASDCGLDGPYWRAPFPKDYQKAEPIRAEITGKLLDLGVKITDTTGDKITEALASFLINDMEMGRTAANIIYRGSKIDNALNDEYRNLWETAVSILESMYSALKDQKISPDDYTGILTSVFGKTLIAKPPQVLDAATVGDMRRTRVQGIKAVFLMGANQGEFPKYSFNGIEFSESETEELCRNGIEIEENRNDRYHRERFLVNRAMTLPSEKLFITAPLLDMARKEKRPSNIILNQKEKIKDAGSLPLTFWASHKTALKFFAARKPDEAALMNALSAADPAESERIKNCRLKNNYIHKIDAGRARFLMKRECISPSSIDVLNSCMFKYFCFSGLRIARERNGNGVEPDALTRGSMVHYVLERVLSEHGKDNYGRFMKLKPADFAVAAEIYLREFEKKEFGGWVRSERKKEILIAHAPGIAEVLRQMSDDMALSGFRPLALEKKFAFMLGETLIKGKTDRLDLLETENAKYIRVIDYKTGSKDFSYPEIEFGLNLQALIYLFAMTGVGDTVNLDSLSLEQSALQSALQSAPPYIPSGAFYRLVNGGKLSKGFRAYGAYENPDDFRKNRIETQKTTGIQFGAENREDYSDIAAINEHIGKNFISLTNLDEQEFGKLVKKTARQLKEKLDSLYSGDVRAVPVYGKISPCPYCDYRNICGNAGKYEEIKISAKTRFDVTSMSGEPAAREAEE